MQSIRKLPAISLFNFCHCHSMLIFFNHSLLPTKSKQLGQPTVAIHYYIIFTGQCRVFIKHRRSENSPAKFCLFPDRALPFHNNSSVTFQYSPVSPILNETPDNVFVEIEITSPAVGFMASVSKFCSKIDEMLLIL